MAFIKIRSRLGNRLARQFPIPASIFEATWVGFRSFLDAPYPPDAAPESHPSNQIGQVSPSSTFTAEFLMSSQSYGQILKPFWFKINGASFSNLRLMASSRVKHAQELRRVAKFWPGFLVRMSKLDLRSEGRIKILDSTRFRPVSGRISGP